ncbi:ATPase, T2SS/T4P/T4SS family, partial [Oligoflexia bacterium]|nr:ATPase, T2SS/T4P/T4SS family [Oligoflexia bacterium]
EGLIRKVSEKLGFELSTFERDEILAQIENDQQPFGLLQELVDDTSVSDIIITDYSRIAVQQGRETCATDLSFPNQAAYEAFVERILQRAGTTYSTKKPVADGMIGSYARVHVVHKALCESGPYLTIRLNRFGTVSTDDLIKCGMAPVEVFRYLCAAVTIGQTHLVVGEVGTGKTTLVRAIAASIPSVESILVIEDTPEIRLEHPHVRYITTREANTDGAGRVSPSECIRAGMRMAMNRIIFGEMRGAEAAEAFIDVCASGHPGLSTIHARSGAEALTRLELFLGRAQKGVSKDVLNEQISTAVQVIVFVDVCKVTKKRRIMEVKEVGGAADGVLRQRDIFKYETRQGLPMWRVVNKVSGFRERLEALRDGVHLNQYPSTLELQADVLYKEAAVLRHAS